MNRYNCDYRVFDGKPMILNSNREQRRKHLKENKNNKFASVCNYCKGKTESVTDDNGSVVCTLCGRIKLINVTVKPRSYTTEITNDLIKMKFDKEVE